MRLALILSVWLAAFAPAFAQWEPERTSVLRDIDIPAGHKVEAATCFFCSVHVEGELKEDAVAQWGDVEVSGKVGGDAVAVAGGVQLNNDAQVAGDIVSVFGDTTLGGNARVGGDVVASVGYVRRSPGASVGKNVESSPWPVISRLPARFRTLVAAWLLGFAISLPLSYLSLRIIKKRRLERLTDAMSARRWRTLLFGVIIFSLLIAAFEVAGESNYADWLELPLCILMMVLAAPGYTAISLRFGYRYRSGSMLAVLIGVLALVTFQVLPVLGWLGMLVLMVLSYGSLASVNSVRPNTQGNVEAASRVRREPASS